MKNLFRKKSSQMLLAVAFWLIVWQIVSMMIGEDIILSSPIRVIKKFLSLIVDKIFWSAIGFSVGRIVGGFILSSILGVVFAVLAYRINIVKVLIEPLVVFIKSVPVASLVILLLFWFSAESLSIVISMMIVFPVTYTNIYTGIENRDEKLREMAKVFKLSSSRRLRYIYLPEVLPYFVSASKISLGLSWKSGIAAEVIAIATGSIGEQLYYSKIYFDTEGILAWTMAIIIVSVVFEKVFLSIIKFAINKYSRG